MSGTALMLSRNVIGLLLFLGFGLFRLIAGFVGDYDESRWTLKTYGGDGAVDFLGESILLDSGFTGSGAVAQADVTVRATRTGTFYFTWTFYGGTATGYKLSRLRNGSPFTVVSRQDYAEGTASFSASTGDIIGFRITSPLDEFPAMAEISGFFAPGQEPAILVPPRAIVSCYGANAIFSVVATNATDFQWQFKGQDLDEEVFEDLILRAVPPADSGSYRVVVRNPLGTVTSLAVPLTIVVPAVITNQPPGSLTRCAGQSVTLSVGAAGSNLQYQWRLEGTPILGATTPTLVRPNLNVAQSGAYSVIVFNACNQVVSSTAYLTVLAPPTITAQPQSVARYVGENAGFFVTVAGLDSIHCQWQRNGVNLPGEASPILSLPGVGATDAGVYSAVISNPCGATVSAGAVLTVTAEPVAIRIVRGKNLDVNIEVAGNAGRQYVLETSSDLRNWVPKNTNWLVISGTPLFYDVANFGARYYRVCPLP